jgi:hypothetical protein
MVQYRTTKTVNSGFGDTAAADVERDKKMGQCAAALSLHILCGSGGVWQQIQWDDYT